MLEYYNKRVKQFTNGAEQRPFYIALQARRDACLPPKKPWSEPRLVEAQRQLFLRVVVTIQNTPVMIEAAKPCLVDIIKKMVCEHYKIGMPELCGPSQRKAITDRRHVAVYLARQHSSHEKYTLPRIGQLFGGRDHTTILHSHRKIAYQRLENATLDAELKEFERRLGVA